MIDYSIKFYKCKVITDNGNVYRFYLAGRNLSYAESFLISFLNDNSDKYHITSQDYRFDIVEVPTELYGIEYGYTIIN